MHKLQLTKTLLVHFCQWMLISIHPYHTYLLIIHFLLLFLPHILFWIQLRDLNLRFMSNLQLQLQCCHHPKSFKLLITTLPSTNNSNFVTKPQGSYTENRKLWFTYSHVQDASCSRATLGLEWQPKL